MTTYEKAARIERAIADLAARYEKAGNRRASFALWDLLVLAPMKLRADLYDAIMAD